MVVAGSTPIGTIALDERFIAALASRHTLLAWTAASRLPQAPVPPGVIAVESIAAACDASVVLSQCSDDHSLLSTAHSPDGLLTCMRAGAIHVATGLHAPTVVEQLDVEHARRGQRFVAAPILLAGGEGQRLAAVVGGPSAATAEIAPLFDAMDVSVFVAGESAPDAMLLAAAHSSMLACAMEAIAEAFALVRKYDVDPAVMRDVMRETLFAGSVYGHIGDAMLAGAYAGSPSVVRGLQILDIAIAAGNSAHVPLGSIDACRDRLLSAVAHGNADRAWTIVRREQDRASGLE
jgi:3-hydroxyisobutyrate dehydrogenase-like beta-hydroxyacid dehydrogenase